MAETIVITDTSVLINFLVLDRVGLLSELSGRRFLITDHVRGEVTAHYGEQLERLNQAIYENWIEEISVTKIAEVKLFAQLTRTGLGIGECSAIAVAAHRKYSLAIDDRRAVKKLENLGLQITTLNTEGLMILLIKQGVLSIYDADAMKIEWENNHRFRLTFGSFAERM